MTPGEHDALITKMIGIFEGSFSADGEAPPRLTLEQAWTSRFVICHWKRSIEPCALADLQPKEIEILSNAICHGDCMDDQVVSALKVWPLHFVMTLLPDVTSLADGVAEDESHETLLERAQVQEWEAKVAAFEARLAIDQRNIVQVSNGLDSLKDTLDWIQMQKHVKQASMAKEAVNIFMDQKFPAVSCDELVDLQVRSPVVCPRETRIPKRLRSSWSSMWISMCPTNLSWFWCHGFYRSCRLLYCM